MTKMIMMMMMTLVVTTNMKMMKTLFDDDDTDWHTCPVSTPLLSKTRAANASSASAWEGKYELQDSSSQSNLIILYYL